jgi:hypothetical protein
VRHFEVHAGRRGLFPSGGEALSLGVVHRVLRVVATDPGSVCDMAAFAEQTGHALLESGEEGGKYVFFLKKA